MTIYTCVESAEYRNTGSQSYMTDEEAWAFAKLIPTDSEHTQAKFEFENKVEVLPIYKQKIQIFWRPSLIEGIWTFDPESLDINLLQA